MEIMVRPIESLCTVVEEMQKQKQADVLAKGNKLMAAAGGAFPPDPPNGPSNLKDLAKLKKYAEMFDFQQKNKLGNFKLNINKQSLTKFLKYLA